MDDEPETYTLCPYCRERVDSGAPDVLYGVEQKPTPGMTVPNRVTDGMGGYFDAGCSIKAAGYAERAKPT